MKSSISFVRAGLVLGASLLVLALSGCGQKGPLYMPRIPPDPRVSTVPTPAKPATSATSATPAESSGTGLEAPPKPAPDSK